jgi:hypothetical protein
MKFKNDIYVKALPQDMKKKIRERKRKFGKTPLLKYAVSP